MRKKSVLRAAVAGGTAVLTALTLTAVGSTAAQAATAYDNNATVNVGLVLEPTDLNVRTTAGVALDQVLIDNVYQGLVGLDPSGKIHDVIAKKHTISKDGKTYTFTLNKGVHFSDGKKLTASGVVWSLDQVKNHKTYQDNADFAGVKSISAPNASTVVIKLATPNIEFLYELAGRGGLVLEQGAKNNLATSAIGTGPFKLSKYKKGDSITLSRDTKNWGPNAGVKSVVFHYIPNRATGVNAAIAGNLQVLTAVDPTLQKRIPSKNFKLVTGTTTDKYTLVFNSAVAPLNDLGVRQALSEAIDPKAVIAAGGGLGVAQNGPIPVGDPGYQALSGKFSTKDAKAKLAAAGQSNLTLTVTIPNIYPTTITDVLVSEFKKVGVTLKVDSVDFTTWLTNVYTNKDYQLSIVDHAEAHDFSNWANPAYYFNYSGNTADANQAKVAALYAKALRQTSVYNEGLYLAQAAEYGAADAPAKWLFTAQTLSAVGKKVVGFPTNGTSNRLNLVNLKVKKG